MPTNRRYTKRSQRRRNKLRGGSSLSRTGGQKKRKPAAEAEEERDQRTAQEFKDYGDVGGYAEPRIKAQSAHRNPTVRDSAHNIVGGPYAVARSAEPGSPYASITPLRKSAPIEPELAYAAPGSAAPGSAASGRGAKPIEPELAYATPGRGAAPGSAAPGSAAPGSAAPGSAASGRSATPGRGAASRRVAGLSSAEESHYHEAHRHKGKLHRFNPNKNKQGYQKREAFKSPKGGGMKATRIKLEQMKKKTKSKRKKKFTKKRRLKGGATTPIPITVGRKAHGIHQEVVEEQYIEVDIKKKNGSVLAGILSR